VLGQAALGKSPYGACAERPLITLYPPRHRRACPGDLA